MTDNVAADTDKVVPQKKQNEEEINRVIGQVLSILGVVAARAASLFFSLMAVVGPKLGQLLLMGAFQLIQAAGSSSSSPSSNPPQPATGQNVGPRPVSVPTVQGPEPLSAPRIDSRTMDPSLQSATPRDASAPVIQTATPWDGTAVLVQRRFDRGHGQTLPRI